MEPRAQSDVSCSRYPLQYPRGRREDVQLLPGKHPGISAVPCRPAAPRIAELDVLVGFYSLLPCATDEIVHSDKLINSETIKDKCTTMESIGFLKISGPMLEDLLLLLIDHTSQEVRITAIDTLADIRSTRAEVIPIVYPFVF